MKLEKLVAHQKTCSPLWRAEHAGGLTRCRRLVAAGYCLAVVRTWGFLNAVGSHQRTLARQGGCWDCTGCNSLTGRATGGAVLLGG